MTRAKKDRYSRRDFLQLSWTLGEEIALPAGLLGCGGTGESSPVRAGETFVEPATLASVNGVLDITLNLAYLQTTLNSKRVRLRSMGGSILSPTLRVNTGDTLRILVVNELPPNPASSEPARHLRYSNSTNLHTHGLHVNPGLNSPGVYGDYVVDDPEMGIQPGQSRKHEYKIRPDHPPGAYFYHPHLHGSTAIQMGSGMAGAMLTIGPGATVEGVVLAPGNRSSVLVQAGMPGTYYLRNLKYQEADIPATLPEDILAEVVVIDEPMPMALPTASLPVPSVLALITDQELASAGGLKRNIVMRAVFDEPRGPPKPPITAEGNEFVHPGDELNDWVFQTGLTPGGKPTTIADTVFALGSGGGAASPNPGMPGEFIPFHTHVNPVQIVKINGQPVEPYWVDTFGLPFNGTPANPTSVTFRTRFQDFKGFTVMHCHMLVHEDMGMMQAVDIV